MKQMKSSLLDLLFIALGSLLFGAVLRVAIQQARSDDPESRPKEWLFFTLVLASLLVWQAPIILLNVEIGGDESLMLAQAMKFKTDFLPWRSVDGTTSGPLNSYVLMWPFLFGMKLSHLTARLTVLACDFLTIFFAQRAFSRIVSPARSFLAVIPILGFFLLAHKQEFIEYTSLHFPLVVLSASLWLVLKARTSPAFSTLFPLGVLLGSVSMIKLQPAPLAAYLFMVAVSFIFLPSFRAGFARRAGLLLALCIGACCVPAAVLIPVAAAGVGPDFLSRYLGFGGFSYPGSASTLLTVARLLFAGCEIVVFLGSLLVWSVFCAWRLRFHLRGLSREWLSGLLLAIGFLFVSFACILKSGAIFRYYFIMAILPSALLACWMWRGLSLFSPDAAVHPLKSRHIFLFTAFCVVPLPVSYGAETLWFSAFNRPPGVSGHLIVWPHSQFLAAFQTGKFTGFHIQPRFNYRIEEPPGTSAAMAWFSSCPACDAPVIAWPVGAVLAGTSLKLR